MMKLILAIAISASCAFSQPFSGPVEGYVFDAPSASIRPILGRPGSAHLGSPQAEGLTFASIAPGDRYGVAMREKSLVIVSGLGGGNAVTTEIMSLQHRPDAASWSPDGRTVALYSRQEGWLQILRGLPESPEAGEAVHLDGTGGIRQVVTDGGSLIVLLGDNLVRLDFDGAPLPVPFVEDAVAIALGFQKDTAYVATNKGAIFELDLRSQWAEEKSGAVGPAQAIHLIEGMDGKHLLAAVHGERLTFIDTVTWEAKEPIVLDFAPEGLQSVCRRTLLLQGRRNEGEPIWLTTSGGAQFVPVPPLNSASEVRDQ